MDESEKLKKENQRLKSENQKLKEILRRLGYILNEDDIVLSGDQRLSLYCDYFKGREDVFAKRYFNQKKQIYQYSFECRNRFKNSCPLKHGGKCSIECYYYDPVPLNEVTIYNHLHTKDYFIALYPLKEDNTCYLLAIDFDKKNWFENMLTVYKIANKYGLPCIMERSQSGNGGHLWFFFETNIKAKKARKLGDFLLKEALKVNKNMSFESFDRMFPNQDYLAKAGLGNCIALPLQYDKKEQGCSVFINEFNKNIPKQFHQLYFTKKITEQQINQIIKKEESVIEFLNTDNISINLLNQIDETITVKEDSMLTIDKKNLSSKTLLTLRKLASIINPEYSEKLGRHFSVYGIPRILCEYIEDDNSIKIPRGLKDKLFQFTSREAIDYIDERCDGDDLDISFKGKLYSYQQEGADTLLKNEIGILEAEPGFGKTIIALYIMSIINKNTLIIVNSRELLKQWKEKIDEFIDYPLPKSKKEGYIGEYYSQKKKLYNHIDIALIQSLSKLTDFDMLKHYGLVIVDECHHASANIYRTVLREINAHYIYSFSATPERKDKLEKITYMYLGNIVYEVNHDEVLKNRKFEQILIPRITTFKVIDEKIPYNEIIDELYQNVKRNHLIISDINKEIENNKNIIVLTDRKNHMDILYNELQYYDYPIFCMSGDNSTKEKEKIKQEINNSKHYLLIATSQLLGEGFDLPSLNTMFMTMPISYQGRLKQYTGRLHRNDKGKTVVTVYDYVDSQVRVLQNMFQKRLKEYKNIGYRTQEENNSEITENTLFDKANYEYFLQHAMSQAKKNIVIFCNDCKIYRIQKLYSFLISLIARNIKVYVCLNKDYDEDILSYIEGVCTRILSSSYHINAIMIDEQELWTSSSSYLGIQSNDLYYIKTKDKDVIEELKIKIES